MSKTLDISPYLEKLEDATAVEMKGRVTELIGLLIKASVPGARIGEVCDVESEHEGSQLQAEVVGFKNNEALLLPLGDVVDLEMGALVVPTGKALSVPVGDALLGRVLDGLGRPIDGQGDLEGALLASTNRKPPKALSRTLVDQRLETGIRVIDGLNTVGIGQRVGIFSGAGVGKSTLLGMLAGSTGSDVNVIAMIGERGREVREFIENTLGEEELAKSVIIVATSDEPPLMRMKAAYAATTIAESFREEGRNVVFMMDSITRFARALREVGLAVGEPPARSGFPPSVFSELPRLLERTGNSDKGTITAFYNVLVEGGDFTEPIADEVKSILDGHLVLSEELAAAGHFPAVDVTKSVSRVMKGIVDEAHMNDAVRLKDVVASYQSQRELIMIGAYQEGSDSRTDYAISKIGAVNKFLRQDADFHEEFETTLSKMNQIFDAVEF